MTPAPHAITTLRLSQFRNYAGLTLEVAPAPVVLHGINGAGKTNILEAISLLAPGRGLRGARLREMDRAEAGSSAPGLPSGWAMSAVLACRGERLTIGTGRDVESTADKRIIKINGEKVRGHAQLAAHCAVQWLTPSMDQVFSEGGSARRKFFDRIVYGFVPEHAARVAAYEQAMRERNTLLGEQRGRADPYWLSVIEQQMAEHAVAITLARIEALQRLSAELTTDIAHFPRAQIYLAGVLETRIAEGLSALEVEGLFAERLKNDRPIDAARGRCGAGPHKSEWTVIHNEKQREVAQCSTGEQKAMILSLLLAAARARAHWCGMPPILLLDEVVAHLDEQKRAALFALIHESRIQAWMTGTDASAFAAIAPHATLLQVGQGAVVSAEGLNALLPE